MNQANYIRNSEIEGNVYNEYIKNVYERSKTLSCDEMKVIENRHIKIISGKKCRLNLSKFPSKDRLPRVYMPMKMAETMPVPDWDKIEELSAKISN